MHKASTAVCVYMLNEVVSTLVCMGSYSTVQYLIYKPLLCVCSIALRFLVGDVYTEDIEWSFS